MTRATNNAHAPIQMAQTNRAANPLTNYTPLPAVTHSPVPQPQPSRTNAIPKASGGITNASLPLYPSAPTLNTNLVPRVHPREATTLMGIEGYPRAIRDVLEAQIVLDREGFSSGSIDGVMGYQTRAALRAYQKEWSLPETGELDAGTKAELVLEKPPLATYLVSSNDLARLQPISPTWVGKSRQTALDYETVLELVAEKSHAHPALIKKLNPAINWTNVSSGTLVQVPDPSGPEMKLRASWITIKLSEKVLQVYDAEANLIAHFPCSIAQRVEKRPVGDLRIEVVIPNPDYTFNPEVFPESAEARKLRNRLIIAPGPNNPVGVAWIGLDKPGYGIHGTPGPEQVGRTESHGCFRLANWNAERLITLVAVGTPVYVKP
jgi:lipoprotein-anchoring transpeptidase ErfK/SrfK